MEINPETEENIKELQFLEQNLQAILMQKQTFEMELNEAENALAEVEKTKDEVFKITGNIMIKSSKEVIMKELNQKKDLIRLRIKSLDSQEKSLSENSEALRKKVLDKIKK